MALLTSDCWLISKYVVLKGYPLNILDSLLMLGSSWTCILRALVTRTCESSWHRQRMTLQVSLAVISPPRPSPSSQWLWHLWSLSQHPDLLVSLSPATPHSHCSDSDPFSNNTMILKSIVIGLNRLGIFLMKNVVGPCIICFWYIIIGKYQILFYSKQIRTKFA